MAGFLKAISAIYLVIVWLLVALFALSPSLGLLPLGKMGSGMERGVLAVAVITSGILASIPAAVLYAFGQVVADVRATRNHLAAMRRYYQPNAPLDDYR